jgi:hypothetical protein
VKVSEATSLEEVAELRGKVLSLTGDIERLAKERPPVIDVIAEGNDVYVVACRMRFRPHRSLPAREQRTEAKLTWDEIFAAIGPLLLSEASEPKLSSYLAQWIGNSRFGVADRAGMTIHVDADAFETIKVQLLSLGLIEASARKHAIQDTDAYWALTPSGRTRLLQLRAVRKPSSRPVERDTQLTGGSGDPGFEPQPAASLSDPPAND